MLSAKAEAQRAEILNAKLTKSYVSIAEGVFRSTLGEWKKDK